MGRRVASARVVIGALGLALIAGLAYLARSERDWDSRRPAAAAGDARPARTPTEPDSRASGGHDPAGAEPNGRAARPEPEPRPDPVAIPAIGWPDLAEARSRFEAEDGDPAWSATTEARLLGLIAELERLALYRHAVDCRESLCRLELLFPPGAAPIDALRQLYRRVAELGLAPVLAEPETGPGPLTLWVFLRRMR